MLRNSSIRKAVTAQAGARTGHRLHLSHHPGPVYAPTAGVLPSASYRPSDQGLARAGGLCVQNFWSRQEAWLADHLHHVPSHRDLVHFNATFLLLFRLSKVPELSRGN